MILSPVHGPWPQDGFKPFSVNKHSSYIFTVAGRHAGMRRLSKVQLGEGLRKAIILAVLKPVLNLILAPRPRVVPGEGPDYHFPKEFEICGPIPPRIRVLVLLLLFVLALRATRSSFEAPTALAAATLPPLGWTFGSS